MKSFKAVGSIGDGLEPILHKSAPMVALFSARGPNIKDYSFRDADLLKPDILAPGSLIWASWSANGTDEPNYIGKNLTHQNYLNRPSLILFAYLMHWTQSVNFNKSIFYFYFFGWSRRTLCFDIWN